MTEFFDICYTIRTTEMETSKSMQADADYLYPEHNIDTKAQTVEGVISDFPLSAQSAFRYLQTHIIPREVLSELLAGFEADLLFGDANDHCDELMEDEKQLFGPEVASNTRIQIGTRWPIATEDDLYAYGAHVAGAPAVMILELAFHHMHYEHLRPGSPMLLPSLKQVILDAGKRMGVALQYVNIARDVFGDARLGRVYIPTTWLKDGKLTHEDILFVSSAECWSESESKSKSPQHQSSHHDQVNLVGVLKGIRSLRLKLLDRADEIYLSTRDAIDMIPDRGVRKAMKVAVESYMEIGRTLRTKLASEGRCACERDSQSALGLRNGVVSAELMTKASVPKWRRIWVAWWTMLNG